MGSSRSVRRVDRLSLPSPVGNQSGGIRIHALDPGRVRTIKPTGAGPDPSRNRRRGTGKDPALAEGGESEGPSREDTPDNIEELLRPLLDAAYGFCLRLTRNEQDAEDLVQEAALKACRGRAGYRPGTNFKAWFFKIIVNAFYERFRRKRPEDRAMGLEDAPAHYLYSRATELGLDERYSDPARALISRLGVERIEEALQSLPEDYRMVCNMYFIEDFTYREIAEMLGIPIGTVRSRLHRGRKLLQKRLWELAVAEGIVDPVGRSEG